jgi:hypothetical protein
MAITDNKITAFSDTHSAQTDRPSLTSAQMKTLLDSSPEELRVALNGLIDDLIATTGGNSGAQNIGSESLLGKTNVYEILESLVEAGSGSIPPDGTITTDKFATGSYSTDGTMADNSDTKVPSQKAVKTYADTKLTASTLTTRGDMFYRNATVVSRIALGLVGAILKSNGTDPVWLAKGTALQQLRVNAGATDIEWANSVYNILTTAGDLLYASGVNTPARLAIVANKVLTSIGGNLAWTSVGAKGTYTDTTTSITSGTPHTASIPLGITPTKGRIILAGNTAGEGGTVHFTTTASDAKSIMCLSGSATVGSHTYLTQVAGIFGTNITLYSAQIDNTNLLLQFRCSSGTNTLSVSSALWEVEI